jgi:hypothetical protein
LGEDFTEEGRSGTVRQVNDSSPPQSEKVKERYQVKLEGAQQANQDLALNFGHSCIALHTTLICF